MRAVLWAARGEVAKADAGYYQTSCGTALENRNIPERRSHHCRIVKELALTCRLGGQFLISVTPVD